MLKWFKDSFPDCKGKFKIIINKFPTNRQIEMEPKQFLRETIKSLEEIKMREFFEIIDKDIYVIEKPPYRTGMNGEPTHSAKYSGLQKKIR